MRRAAIPSKSASSVVVVGVWVPRDEWKRRVYERRRYRETLMLIEELNPPAGATVDEVMAEVRGLVSRAMGDEDDPTS